MAYSAVAVLGRCVAVVASIAACLGGTAAAAVQPAVTLRPSSAELTSGQTVTLSGRAPPGATVQLNASPYPYRSASPAGTATADSGGGFSFTVRPDRNTRYQAVAVAATPSSTVTVQVLGLTITKVRALPLGRAQVTLVVFHPRDLEWGGAKAQWSFASGSQGAFASAPATTAYALSPSVAVLKTTITLPAGPFEWRACLRAGRSHCCQSA